MDVVQGTYAEKTIRIAQWAIRDSRVLPRRARIAGAAFTLTVERYDAHPELEGERLHLRQRDVDAAAVLRRRPAAEGRSAKVVFSSYLFLFYFFLPLCCCITPCRGGRST